MNQLEGLLILLAFPLSLLLSGYWLAALLTQSTPVERLAFSLPMGLALLLAAAATVNFFLPLSGAAAYGCLIPILMTVLLPKSRSGLWQDLTATVKSSPRLILFSVALFFGVLLWPMLVNPATIFYDGTSNHDSFFWIASAEHLKRYTYMELPVFSATHPLTSQTAALIGWQPAWGRMGAEGLLAMASSVVGASPLKLYLYATASLAVVWFATVFLALRTFVTEQPAVLTGAVLVSLQPIFIFFYGNGNLPNLLGTLMGAAMIIAVERAARVGTVQVEAFTAWTTLAAFSLHGLLCSYPEITPFVLLPCGLLWLRPWFTQGPGNFWRTGLLISVVLLAAFALNPVTTVRAGHGFMSSFNTARADANWANLFNPLDATEYIPALFSLSISGAKELNYLWGIPLSLLMVACVGLVLWRSRDRFGLAAGMAGAVALLGYTLLTDFAYGWQKTVQFSGVFFALIIPVAAVEVLVRLRAGSLGRQRVVTLALGGLIAFMAYATFMNCRDIYKWSDRKVISADWFALRSQARNTLSKAPVLIEAGSFRMAFFHGMWAAYFLTESEIYYGSRGEESGGYLRNAVFNETNQVIPPPQAVLVGRAWADTFDANSPRILTGREFVLLQKSNRMLFMGGVQPLNGLPDNVSEKFAMTILPHSPGNLLIELSPRSKIGWPAGDWRIKRSAAGAEDFTARVTGPSPWLIQIPLIAAQLNQIDINLVGQPDPSPPLTFSIRRLRIDDRP